MSIRSIMAFACVALLAACGEEAKRADTVAAAPEAAAPAVAEPAEPAGLPRQPAPEDAKVYFISPRDGDVVSNPVTIVFGLRGAGVAPAGVMHEGTGHHHLLIDTDLPPLDQPIPADDNHMHFGLGQTETELTLPPGERRLQLLLGDHLHIPHDPPLMSEVITIRVE